VVADPDEDGDKEILVSGGNLTWGFVYIYEYNGDYTWTRNEVWNSSIKTYRVAVGDANNDATSTQARHGSWRGVDIDSDASGRSVFDNTIFRYGGLVHKTYGHNSSDPFANLRITNSFVTINNSIFEYSTFRGMTAIDSDTIITNNIFRDNNKNEDVYFGAPTDSAVIISGGNTVFKNNIVENNERGLNTSNISGLVDSNIFDSNKDEAVYATGDLPRFSGNSASGNKINGIKLYSTIPTVGSTTTVTADLLPYVLDDYDVSVRYDSTLVVEKGVVFKSPTRGIIKVFGNLVIEGEKSDDIIFTSIYDDTTLPGTYYLATTTPSFYDHHWKGIHIREDASMDAKGFTIRYAGNNSYGNGGAGVLIEGGIAHISEALFTNNYLFGLMAKDSESLVIEDTVFIGDNYSGKWGPQRALGIYNSSTTLSNLLFEDNAIGITSDTVSTFTTNLIEFIEDL